MIPTLHITFFLPIIYEPYDDVIFENSMTEKKREGEDEHIGIFCLLYVIS